MVLVRVVRIAAVLAVVLTLMGCSSSASPELEQARAVAAPYGLTVVEELASREVTLPASLDIEGTNGFDAAYVYAQVQEVASVDGYDLTPYLGKRVVERDYRLRERHSGERTSLQIIELDGRVVAAFASVDNSTPGLVSLSELGGE